MSTFDQPLADEVDLAGNRFKIYEEFPGQFTVSFSKSPGMWSGFTIPAEASDLLLETVAAAVAALAEDAVDRILVALNAYEGDNVWQDVIMGLDGYDKTQDDALRLDGYDDAAIARLDNAVGSNSFALTDGTTFRYDGLRSEWFVA